MDFVNCACCSSEQRYNFLKANHNLSVENVSFVFVVRQNKDTIFWKQITTPLHVARYGVWLFVRTKIQFFESKSQQRITRIYSLICCSSEQRYNFLKANHNGTYIGLIRQSVVRQNKDTIFWKQITTISCTSWCKRWLFVRTKIQFFESKSQLSSLS